MLKPNLLLVLHNADISYVKGFQQILNKHFGKVGFKTNKVEYKNALAMEASKHNTTLIGTTSLQVMKLVDPFLDGSVNDNIGTVLEFEAFSGKSYRIILLPSLKTIFTSGSGRFRLNHYCDKLVNGGILKKDKFVWEFVEPANLEQVREDIESGFICGVDIETSRDDLKITSCAYTVMFSDYTTKSYVVMCSPTNYPFCITALRVLNKTSTPKVMQNGKYDAQYFIRFNAPLHNWIYDTYHMMHCIFPELPRDLAFISSFFLDNFRFWKDEVGNNLYEYNAKDTHNTVWVFLAMMLYTKQPEYNYAIANYLQIFPVIFPAISCALDGMEVDEEIRVKLLAEEETRKQEAVDRLNFLIGEQNFNPGSPKQVGQLMLALGYRNATGTDVKQLQKWKESHVLYERIVDLIWEYRKAAKAISTYFTVELLNGRLLYQLDPSGTETGRMASSGSGFWCGTQIQNIPQYARKMVKAEDGWLFGAVDKAQSESYCTAYLSQDIELIRTVTTSPDFHCQNASLFFGIPFEELYDVELSKVINKNIRTVAKKVNHGANYNMGAQVLLDSMGTANVLEAKRLLKLPAIMHVLKVCEYLLACFDRAYPRIRGEWYKEITREILQTGKLYIPRN